MNTLKNYITAFTGFPVHILPLRKDEMKGLATYIREAYTLSRLQLNNVDLLLVEPKAKGEPGGGYVRQRSHGQKTGW